MATSTAALALELCRRISADLRQQRPHLVGAMRPACEQHERTASMLDDIGALMLKCADDPDANEAMTAFDLVNQAIIIVDQSQGLDPHSPDALVMADLFDLRGAIQSHQDRVDWPQESEPLLTVQADRQPGHTWNRQEAALDLAKTLQDQVSALSVAPLLERAAGNLRLSNTSGGLLLSDIRTRLGDIIGELESDAPSFDLAIRLANGAYAQFVLYERLDPKACTNWQFKAAIATLLETLGEAKQDPTAPPIN